MYSPLQFFSYFIQRMSLFPRQKKPQYQLSAVLLFQKLESIFAQNFRDIQVLTF